MNTLTIARKELNSYFRSPIAYGVMAFFALIAGYFFYASVLYFVRRGIESSMMGQSFPMDINEFVIRPFFDLSATSSCMVLRRSSRSCGELM